MTEEGVLDTCFFIDLRSGHNPGAAALWSKIKANQLSAAYSAVTVLELWKGRSMNREEETFHELTMSFLSEEPITGSASRLAGRWLRPFSNEMARLLLGDALISAVAAQLGVPVYTANRRDFDRFPVSVIEY